MIDRYRDGDVPAVDVDPALAPDFDGLREEVSELLDGAEITQALDRIWQRVRRLNRYVEERAPWQLAKDEAKAGELDQTLRSLAEGLRVVTVLLSAYIPETADKLLAALGAQDRSLEQARVRRRAGRRARREGAAALPEAAVAGDRLPHPSRPRARRPRPSWWRPRARWGSGGSSRSGSTSARGARRSPPPRLRRGVRGDRPPPQQRHRVRRRDHRRGARAGRPPALPGDRRDRPRLLPRLRAAARPGARVPRPHRRRARARQAARHPHPRGRGRHDRHAAPSTRRASR